MTYGLARCGTKVQRCYRWGGQKNTARIESGGILLEASGFLAYVLALRRRSAPKPSRPSPTSASEPGSGTKAWFASAWNTN